MILSAKTPENYARYLMERNYEIIYAGEDNIDFRQVLELLHEKYQCDVVLTDSGGTLNRLLLEEGLVDEISLMISPVITGTGQPRLFSQLQTGDKPIKLELIKEEKQSNQDMHLQYKVLK
jgi:2,5-diamino-6-(ribosylamino)-4(3H)-pyrimidinone 5'-phosphate reductase